MDSSPFINRLIKEGFKPRSYSGRGMYGKECVAVSVHGPIEGHLPMAGIRSDSLGLGTIYYWPNYPWPKTIADSNSEFETA